MSQRMMKAAVLTGPKNIQIKSFPVPEVGPCLLYTSPCHSVRISHSVLIHRKPA